MDIKNFNRYAFFLAMGMVTILLLYKAIHIPILKDEWETPVKYINHNVWEIMMYTSNSPNNHILNTLLVKLFVFVFGSRDQLILRLPNIFAFLIYGIAIFRINRVVLKEDSSFFIPAALFFIVNPYLLDFFGLCRGYGLSSSLALLSVSFMVSGYFFQRERSVWAALGISLLASYANFTLLVFWGAITLMTWAYFIIKEGWNIRRLVKPTLTILFVNLLYLALIATPILKMQSTDEFRFWTSKGFYYDTIYPLIEYSRSGRHMIFEKSHIYAVLIFGILLANISYILIGLRKSGWSRHHLYHPAFVTTAILLLTALVNIVQCMLLHTPNLHGRTALFFYPLFIAVFVSFLGLFNQFKGRWILPALAPVLTFLAIFHLADSFRLDWARDNYFDVNTFDVVRYIDEQYQEKPVSLKTSWLFYHSFDYYRYINRYPWLELKDYDESVNINTDAKFYYVPAADVEKLEPTYEVVYKPDNERWLLMRKE